MQIHSIDPLPLTAMLETWQSAFCDNLVIYDQITTNKRVGCRQSFRLKVKDSHNEGASFSHSGRRTTACCDHVWKAFLLGCFGYDPTIKVSGGALPKQSSMSDYRDWLIRCRYRSCTCQQHHEHGYSLPCSDHPAFKVIQSLNYQTQFAKVHAVGQMGSCHYATLQRIGYTYAHVGPMLDYINDQTNGDTRFEYLPLDDQFFRISWSV